MVFPEEPLRTHPVQGRCAQINTAGVGRRETGLMADDINRHTSVPAAPQESRSSIKKPGFGHTGTVNLRLQAAPVAISVRTGPQRIPQDLLALSQGHIRPSAPARRIGEQMIITNKGVVEINADTHGISKTASPRERL